MSVWLCDSNRQRRGLSGAAVKMPTCFQKSMFLVVHSILETSSFIVFVVVVSFSYDLIDFIF